MKARRSIVSMLALLTAFAPLAQGRLPNEGTAAVKPSDAIRRACWKVYVLVTCSREEDRDAIAQIDSLLKSEKSAVVLHGVAVWALNREYAHLHDGECPICDRYEDARGSALWALSERDDDEAARLLVSFLDEKNLRGNAHGTETLYETILHMGKRTLPFLKPLRDRNIVAKDLIDAFRKGKSAGW
jgi:hypothetical protein